MTWKVRDPGGTQRTIVDAKIRDSAGTLRDLVAKVRDGTGTLQTVHSAAAPPAGTVIEPAAHSTATTSKAYTAEFTVSYTGTATAIVWDSTDAVLVSGQGTATASFRITDYNGAGAFSSIYCDVTIGGVTTRAYATMEHIFTGGENFRDGFNSPDRIEN